MYRILFLLGFFGLITSALFAQKYSFSTYSIEQGLPQSQVTAISQDSQGYLWVATLGGMAKFNGREFTTYSVEDGLLNNRIKTFSYIDNTLWVGHDGGISYIKGSLVKKIPFDGDKKSSNVSKIIKFQGKILICSTSRVGGGLFELRNDKIVRIEINLSGEEARDGIERIRGAYVYKDELFLATKSGVLRTADLKLFYTDKELPVIDFRFIDRNSEYMYFVTHKRGVYKRDIESGELIHLYGENLEYEFYGAHLDSKDNLWLTTQKGAVVITDNNTVKLIDDKKGLPVNTLGCFYEDTEGNIWIGSEGRGVFRYPGEAFKYFDKSTVLSTDLVVTGFQKENGDLFLGTYEEGILKMTPNKEVSTVFDRVNIIWTSVTDVAKKDWLGTQSSLISIDENGVLEEYIEKDYDLPGKKITALYRLGPNSMYIGGNSGVSLYENGKFTKISDADKKSIGTVREFAILDGITYCVSDLGLFKYVNGDFEQVKDIQGRPINNVSYSLKKDDLGQLWYGTEEGLFRYRDGKAEKVVLLDHPAANHINFINFKEGALYVGTNNGFFILSNLGEEIPSIERFGTGEGMVDLETNLNSGFFDLQGNFWFGSSAGLVCYHPKFKVENRTIPIIHIKSILLNYEPFDYALYSDELDGIGLPLDLNLPYSKNNLTFELDGISLRHQFGIKYQFWLEGVDNKWSPLTKNSALSFNGLEAGDYVLRVRCVDINGNVSEESRFSFTIMQAYYRTWWFIGICALVVAGLVVLFFRFRLRRINEANEKERLEYKTRLLSLEQQSMNASMNRHFVFNSLNSIQYFINTRDRISANKYLTNFAKLIRKNLDSATADGNVISLDEELERLHLYMSLESMRFKDRFDYEINVKNVDTESIMIPAMVLQPFVENSIIHGILPDEEKKGKITIDVINDHGDLIIRVEDNGIGVKQSLSKKVEIDGDHRSKGMEITSKRIELIQKISKNNISLEGPSELVGNDGSIKGTYVLLKIPQVNLDI